MKLVTTTLLFFGMLTIGFAQDFPTAQPVDIALFPQQNDIRNTLKISGIWKFKKDSLEVGEHDNWKNGLKNARQIAVPGSWNEQFTDMRDYLGMGWYETNTWVPAAWKGQRIYIRVGSANYAAKVWVNGQAVGMHEGGHLPFAFEISEKIRWKSTNRIVIQVENKLKPSRVPTGNVEGGFFSNFPKSNYDFFPYAGLHRDVWLYTVPSFASVKDISVKTEIKQGNGVVSLEVFGADKARLGQVVISGDGQEYTAGLAFLDKKAIATITIPNAHLWSTEDPFLYKMDVTLSRKKEIIDRYSMDIGIRTIEVTENQLLLNGKPIFLKGFGKHEDFPIFGKGTAHPVMVKDFELMKWTGANSFRTSHYPYDEAFLRMADREGFLIIDETPAVGLFFHGDTTDLALRQQMCRQYIDELITRDKNHPSVIMWCIANEPFPASLNLGGPGGREATPESIRSFRELFEQVKARDDTRPATLVGVMGGPAAWVGMGDVICLNRYYGWYTHTGDMARGAHLLGLELDGLHKTFKKPIIITEFGADTYPGMHAIQPEMFTEEFQTAFIKGYLDIAAERDFVVGMHVWAFSDFKTSQAIMRFGGINYKGVFTRDRKPKAAAHYLRSRWFE